MTEEEREKKRKEALIDYNKAKNDLRIRNMSFVMKTTVLLVVILMICIVIRVCFGRLYLPMAPSFYKGVEYKLLINGEHESIGYEDVIEKPIIPGFLYSRISYEDVWYNMDKLNEDLIFDKEKVVLDFVVSECYTHTDHVRTQCKSNNEKLVHDEVDAEFTRMLIRKNGKNQKVMYDGKFINDISKYVKEKGYYYIEINARYDDIKTKLYLFPRRIEDL